MTRAAGSGRRADAKERELARRLAKIARAGGPNLFDFVVGAIERFAQTGTFDIPAETEQWMKRELYRLEFVKLRPQHGSDAKTCAAVAEKHGIDEKTVARALKSYPDKP